jgi:hypothetical protein
MKQPPPGAQTPEGVHEADWQSVAPFCAVQLASPLARPHCPFEPQALLTQSAADVQGDELPCAQVEVTALHRPVSQAALTPPTHEACRPSPGNVAPGPAFGVQVKVLRAQNEFAPQSSSTQQPDAEGTQALVLPFAEALQKPERQAVAAWAASQGPSPAGWPQAPSPPQMLVTHSLAAVHTSPLPAAQVLVTALHVPLTQAALASCWVQTPWWRAPSLGSAAPATPRATHT